jgi:hypothetical protein
MNRRGTGYERPWRPAGADAVSGLDLRRQRDQELMRRVDQQRTRAVAARAGTLGSDPRCAQSGQAELRECIPAAQFVVGNDPEEREAYGGAEQDGAEQVVLGLVVGVDLAVVVATTCAVERARSWSLPQERHEVNLSHSPTRRASSLLEGCSAQPSAPVVPQATAAKVLDGGDGAGSEAAVAYKSKRGNCSEEAGSGGCACGVASISIGMASCGGDAEGGAWAQEQEQEIVRLNVGGQGFCTTLQTLRSQDSMLAAMFSGRFRPGPSDAQVDGCLNPRPASPIWHPDAMCPDTRCAVRRACS